MAFFVFGLLRDTQKSVDDLEEGETGRGRSRDKNIFCLIEADCCLLSGELVWRVRFPCVMLRPVKRQQSTSNGFMWQFDVVA